MWTDDLVKVAGIPGSKTHGTGQCGDTWGRPMSSSGRLSAVMMMMMILYILPAELYEDNVVLGLD